MVKSKVKVVIVDDSALIRAVLQQVLSSDPRLDVVAAAQDAYEARELIKKHDPDVITLDIEMPKMNGIVFLQNLMRLRPMPVVMISTLTQEGAPETLRALELGAVDYVAKPKTGSGAELGEYARIICEKVYIAANARVRSDSDKLTEKQVAEEKTKIGSIIAGKHIRDGFICAIGASTGGTEAIKEVVSTLPENAPPIVIAQHIPESFSASFAKRVNNQSAVTVHEASNNQPIRAGNVYIAPGHSHLRVRRAGASGLVCQLEQSELVNRHRPAVEVLFDSVTQVCGRNSLGVMLTGMGADGAEAMLRMKSAGIPTVAQDEQSSVVWGMPGAAVKLGAVSEVVTLSKISRLIMTHAFGQK